MHEGDTKKLFGGIINKTDSYVTKMLDIMGAAGGQFMKRKCVRPVNLRDNQSV